MQVRWSGLIFVPLVAFLLVFVPGLWSPVSDTQSATSTEYQPTPRPAEACDVCEPNNEPDQACGPLAPGTKYRYPIRCTANRDDDFYYIDLASAGNVTLDLTDIPPGTDYDLYLDREDGSRMCYSRQYGNAPEHVTCYVQTAGRYYVWVHPFKECNDNVPYGLTVSYPTPVPSPPPTSTPTPPCNVHIDDFEDHNPDNDLGHPSNWELDPPGCGTFDPTYTGVELQLDYDLTISGDCTGRYTTGLSLGAFPYKLLAFEIRGDDEQELANTVVGLRDQQGREMGVKVGDHVNRIVTGAGQAAVDVPLASFATTVDISRLESLFIQSTDSQGTVYLDSLRLESSLAPLTVDNFDDLADPNALGGAPGIHYGEGSSLQTSYVSEGTYDGSPGSLAISYTVPAVAEQWALWETDLRGLDVSDYAFLSFYIKGSGGRERINVYLRDTSAREAYVNVEDYVPIGTDWTAVRIPLGAFEDVALTNLDKVKYALEWEPMSGTISLDNLRFVAESLLVDNFCDDDGNNSLNGKTGTFTSAPACSAVVTSTLSEGVHRLDYDVTAGPDCFSGYWSKTALDLNPYRSLAVKVRGERCGQVATLSASTDLASPEKVKLSDYLPAGITDQWQRVSIPLSAFASVTDWARGDAFNVAFEERLGASAGRVWWDDVSFQSSCATLWVDNFEDGDRLNALGEEWRLYSGNGGVITASASVTQSYGDGGTGLVLDYAAPGSGWVTWQAPLGGADLSHHDQLVFEVKGVPGGETPHIYIKDSHENRRFVNLYDYVPPSTKWQTVAIPLEDFGFGPIVTQTTAIEVVVEPLGMDSWGTVSLDNIRFLPSAGCRQTTGQDSIFLPVIIKEYRPPVLDPTWDFEKGSEGWTHQTYLDSQAVVGVESVPYRSRWGGSSLALSMDLVGGDSSRGQGEAFVDIAQHPPPGAGAPLDLRCRPVSCWLYVPTCGLGDPAEPNQAQLFAKDLSGKSEYGTPTQVVRDRWFEVNLRPSIQKPEDGYMDQGFNPSEIALLGVKIRAASGATTYRGKVYVDACGWREIDPTGLDAAKACLVADPARRVSSALAWR